MTREEANTVRQPEGAAAMRTLMTDLYPICRSITGEGVRETLRRIGEQIPLEIHEVSTGTQVFDWTVPQEWNIRDAYVADTQGRRVVDFHECNLHVVSYSEPIHKRMAWDELCPRLHTLPDHPDWIPYRTAYYDRTWGFCVSHHQYNELQGGEFEVMIDSSLKDGALTYGEAFFPGQSADEILFSCHICHPSLANDNLSGIAVAVELAKSVSQLKRRYSYRFLFIPGTIGAITWLSQNEAKLDRIKHGLVLALLGDRGPITYKRTRHGDTEIDHAVCHVLQHGYSQHRVVPFEPYGYDERQFGSPGINLPIGCLMRTPHGQYAEYHTSADNLEFVSDESLNDSLIKVTAVVGVLEQNRVFTNQNPKCEPQLGRRGIYRAMGGHANQAELQTALLWVLNQSDGEHSLLDIAEHSGLSFATLRQAAETLRQHDLLAEDRDLSGVSEMTRFGMENPISAQSRSLQEKAHAVIPGGAHTYAKGDDQFPVEAPPFLVRGQGCHVADADGNWYIEYGAGLRSVTLGHAFPSVVKAASSQMQFGANLGRPTPLEVECAEAMLDLVPGADMIKFAKNGSDVTTAALRLARAYTGRSLVGVCADQPFFSADDWFIGATELTAGIPDSICRQTLTFQYNDPDSLRHLFEQHPGQIACVFLEAATYVEPADGFLEDVRELCTKYGALMILDEVVTGFRWGLGGAQNVYGVQPDLSTFGKGMANGFSIAALLGKREIMRLGGIDHDQPRVFLLSTTNGAETHSLAAAIETIRIYREQPVIEQLYRQGERLRSGLEQEITKHGVGGHVAILGRPCNMVYATRDQSGNPSQPFRTLFLQEIIQRGLIAPSLVLSYSHSDADIDYTVRAIGEALTIYRRALDQGVEEFLKSRPVKPVNRRYN